MLDKRVESFLTVCKYRNYTKAAKELNLTQPAVTQHIQYLENEYGTTLFAYRNKVLTLTKAGQLFLTYATQSVANERILRQKIRGLSTGKMPLRFAATLTIGEYTLAPVLKDFLKKFACYEITFYVDNTEVILQLLEDGEISFALVEGLFNKDKYHTTLLKRADFILITSPCHPLAKRDEVTIDDLKKETLIIREKGSGSREILERGLFDINRTISGFNKIIEVGNVNLIKRLVKEGVGISFIYRDAVWSDIQANSLAFVAVNDFKLKREFNFISAKNSYFRSEIEAFERYFAVKVGK